MGIYKSVKISIGTFKKDPEMLKFVLITIKLNKCVNMQLKNYLLKWDILHSVLDFHKNQQICDKAVDNYLCVLEFVAKCYKSQKICDKAVNTPHSSTIKYIPDTSRLGMLSAFFCFFYRFFWAGK